MTLDYGLAGKHAVVVGAGLGIGRDCAMTLASAGAAVMCVDIDEQRAAEVARAVTESGGKAASFVGDVTVRANVEALRDETDSVFGGADVVIDIVGLAFNFGILEISDEDWDRNFRLNLVQNFLVTQVFARYLREREIAGSIVHIGSATGFLPHIGSVAYSAAKAGLNSLIQSSAVELAPYSIRVNGVAPGVVDTPRRRAEFTDASVTASLKNVPMRRFATTQEIANTAVFLSSGLASYISGQIYLVDGGAMAVGPFPSALPETRAV
ncbi:SDR family NAD(P)-dependent oxidoreductase [Amycolatopsis sp. GM8]|uniref:SDR family NAD(P)-dependent oxidoreductase n=1 Tax=Amycolatopsis sp. GM8 TaxID=2896530 RepID=UPI001F3776FB|nr:SDR family NAD(P)-dependent oxidoreductase [Amycolatopsis sp. GM8]